MVSQDLRWMESAFAALANENRLSMFQHLRNKLPDCNVGDGAQSFPDHCCSVGELVANLEVTQATVSHHLKELSRADLIETKRRGRFIYCSVNESAVERLEVFFRSGVPAPAAVS